MYVISQLFATSSGEQLALIQGFPSPALVCQYKTREPNLFYYLLDFSMVLAWSDMLAAPSKIWTRITDSISKNDYRYTIHFFVGIYMLIDKYTT